MLLSALQQTDYQDVKVQQADIFGKLEMGSPPCPAQNLKRKFGYVDVGDISRNFLTVNGLQTLFSRQLKLKQVWHLLVLFCLEIRKSDSVNLEIRYSYFWNTSVVTRDMPKNETRNEDRVSVWEICCLGDWTLPIVLFTHWIYPLDCWMLMLPI